MLHVWPSCSGFTTPGTVGLVAVLCVVHTMHYPPLWCYKCAYYQQRRGRGHVISAPCTYCCCCPKKRKNSHFYVHINGQRYGMW